MKTTNKSPLILNGKDFANIVCKEIEQEIKKLNGKRPPGLAVVLVGNNPASMAYVNNKAKKAKEIGIYSEVHTKDEKITEEELIKTIKLLNSDEKIDGIIVQLPLPKHINSEKILEQIDPNKDVDGLHPINLGKLVSGNAFLKPCTPYGIIEMLKHYSIEMEGKNIVIIGRSNLVGKPLSLLFLLENATITVVHSKTKDIEAMCKKADILAVAIGKPKLVTDSWVKDDAVVIDVGINKIFENEKGLLVGDIDFEKVSNVCKAITPVPGGVGPVTVAMLMKNTLRAYKNKI